MLRSKIIKSFLYCLTFQIILLNGVLTIFSHSFYGTSELSACLELESSFKCKCIMEPGNLHNHCASIDVAISPRHEITIQCNDSDIESFFKEFPDNIIIGPVYRLNILNCSLGYNNSIKDILKYMGVRSLNSFNFTSNQRFLHTTQFDGLQGISDLQFAVESFEALTSDLFENMSNLLGLRLYTNQSELPKGIFDPLINLRSLKLNGKYYSMKFPDGIFDSLKDLKTVVINRMKNLKLSKDIFASTAKIITLELNEITALPSGIFDNLSNLESLTLMNNPLNNLTHGLFHKTSQLKNFTLSTNGKGNLRTLPSEFLANLTHLELVKLSASFEELPEDLFYGSRNIIYIDLSRNKLRNLPANLFRDQKSVEYLNLNHNLLITLPDGIFRHKDNLWALHLSHNQLSRITGSVFGSLIFLEVLSLDHNRLNFIEDVAFPYFRLQQLFLSHNQLVEIPGAIFGALDTLWLLYLDNNNMSSIASDTFCYTIGLKIVHLEYNNLNTNSTRTFLKCLSSLRFLERLDLSFNKIATITNEDLKFTSFSYLDLILTGNQIETIPLSLIDLKFAKGATINLDENPIECDCKIVDFVKYLKNHTNVEVKTENLHCKQPIKFQGKKLMEIDPCDLRCQNDDPALCPESCRCEYTTFCDTFIIDCSDAELVHLPTLPTLDSLKFSKIVLNLHNNFLKNLQRNGSKTYDMVISLNLTGNSLESIEASHLPANVDILDLRGNNLRSLPAYLFDFWSRNSSKLKEIYLAHNPWPCECESRSLLEFMHSENNKVADRNNVLCFNSTNHHQLLINYKVSQLCRYVKSSSIESFIVIIASVIAFCGLMIGVLATLYHRHKDEIKVWLYSHNMCLCFVSMEESGRDKQYDGFVSYSHRDKEFVQMELIPFLEHGPHPFKICDHERDWLVGDIIPEQIIKSVENSRRTLIILSDNYLESVWGRMEFQAAHQLAMKERQAKVIIILYGELKHTERIDAELKAYLNMNTYLEWGNPWFWRKLLYAMPHSKHSNIPEEVSNSNKNTFNMINHRLGV